MEEKNNRKIDKYEDIYRRLKKSFDTSFGNEKRRGLISIPEIKKLVNMRRREDIKNNLPENSLIEIPENLFETLKETYTSRDSDIVSGVIGCSETPEEQLDGITNMALLIYLSNHLSKTYKFKANEDITQEKKDLYKKNEGILLGWKDMALTDIIASIYVLSNTDEKYNDYFSYGNRKDDENRSTFVIDLPYIGQLCVHFGWERNKKEILKNAQNTAKSILEKKVELGQITENKLNEITSKLDAEGILPEYEGKLYEYVGAMPIEYIGDNMKKYRKLIDNKLPENVSSEDINMLTEAGLNERELYYFFIKIGASRSLLQEISGVSKKVTPESIENATDGVTIEEFNSATQDLKHLSLDKDKDNHYIDIEE